MVALVNNYSKHEKSDIDLFIQRNHRDPSGYKKYRERWIKRDVIKETLFALIETNSKCNFACPMCVQSEEYAHTKNMSVELFEKILSEISINKIPSVSMNLTNEALLDKKIFDRIDEVSKIKTVFDIHMNTNASLLNEERSIKILNSQLTRLLIGFDAFTKETYEKVRAKGDYDSVMSNILNFLELKKKLKKKFPVVRISFVKTSDNEHEVVNWYNFWKDKVDYIAIQEFITPFADDSREYLIPKSSERTNYKSEDIVCTQPSERVSLRGNGDVLPCCSHFATEMPVGNLNENTLSEINKSEKFLKLKNDLLEPHGYKKHKYCKDCIEVSYGLKKNNA